MPRLALACLLLPALAACAAGGRPEIAASGNYVTTTHAALDFDGGAALAQGYCRDRNREAVHLRTDVETRTISYFECVEPGAQPTRPTPELKDVTR